MSRAALPFVHLVVEPDDPALFSRLRRGDATAFDAVYARYRPRLYSFLLRLARHRQVAEDLLQETWLRLAQRATRLPPETRLAAWLFTVARNLFVSHYRWARLRTVLARPSSDGHPDTPFELAAAHQTERRLEQAVGALPPRYREVLLLVAVERFEPMDVAAMLGASHAAVRQRLARARKMVATALGGGPEIGEPQ